MKIKLYIIVLHFGNSKITQECIRSIKKCIPDYKEIVVVDNDKLNIKPQKRTVVIKNRKNLGYAGGMNVGIRYSLSKGANFVLLLNNDVVVENDLSLLAQHMEKEQMIGITAPAIRFRKKGKQVFDLGGHVNFMTGRTGHDEVQRISSKEPCLVDYASGCCIMIKREVFRKVGFFDKQFFLYFEDVDFCLRAKRAGFDVVVQPKFSIFHKLSSSVGKDSSFGIYHQTKSLLLFGKKHMYKTRVLNILYAFVQSTYFFLKNPSLGISAFNGFFSGL